MKTFLFQGDSITDAIRFRTKDQFMGSGYPTMVAGKLSTQYPGELTFINRGISGDRSIDMYARIKKDVLLLKPQYLSILIGVNDVWHELEYKNGVDPDKYERNLKMFISEIKEAIPDIVIFVLEPFCLHGESTDQYYEPFRAMVDEMMVKAKKVAEDCEVIFVPLQDKMNEFAEKASPQYVLIDGVHPTWCGHAIIADALTEAFNGVYNN